MKKLLITSTDLMMIQFLAPHVRFLKEHGFRIDLACSDAGGRMGEVRDSLETAADRIHTVRLSRNPLNLGNLLGYRDMLRLLKTNHYDIIWTNEPVMGAVTRLAAAGTRRHGTRVLYLCHGFHFYKGAGLLQWLLIYPLEWFLSWLCDCIVTINHQDEARARSFPTPRVEYIHGIGMNPQRTVHTNALKSIRAELSVPENAFLLLSVGELNTNKNHRILLQALAELRDPSIHYLLCGKGPLESTLKTMTADLHLSEQVHFLGYRQDVLDICRQSDVFVLPSYREGLSVASLEAMYCGLPLISSKARGTEDYLKEGISGFLRDADDVSGFADAIRLLRDDTQLRERCGAHNRKTVIPYTLEHVQQELLEILKTL